MCLELYLQGEGGEVIDDGETKRILYEGDEGWEKCEQHANLFIDFPHVCRTSPLCDREHTMKKDCGGEGVKRIKKRTEEESERRREMRCREGHSVDAVWLTDAIVASNWIRSDWP